MVFSFFFNQFFFSKKAKAFLNAVTKDQLLILDLFAEISPQYNVTENFYDRNFVWCMLHNCKKNFFSERI